MTPFMLFTLGLGTWLIFAEGLDVVFAKQHWLHAKLLLVLALCGYHGWMGATVKRFARNENTHSHKYYRIMNELPVLALFAIVILVVVKPFAGG
jgi:putative membrane protein